MKRRIVRLPRARRDLVEIGRYLKRRSPRTAARFLDAAERAFRQLAATPEIGGVFETTDPALQGFRAWPIPGFEYYLIFYIALPNRVEVVRVLHGAQDTEAALEG